MTYMGSKRKYKKDILPIINNYIKDNNITSFYDCFVGGANLIDGIICENLIGIDLSPTLIALHKQMQEDPSVFLEDIERAEWDLAYTDYKNLLKILSKKSFKDITTEDLENFTYPLYQIGAIEWWGSFSAGGFSSGYAKPSPTRVHYPARKNTHLIQSRNNNYQKINFICESYSNIKEFLSPNSLLYCDAPYFKTKPYQISNKFNFEQYYNWLEETSKSYPIFVSEQYLPEYFNKFKVWEKEAKRTIGVDNNFKASEVLWLIDNRT